VSGRGAGHHHAADRLLTGEFGDLPTDFTYLLHVAADFSESDYDRALRVNARARGCSSSTAGSERRCVMSTVTTYKPNPDRGTPSRGRSARRRNGAPRTPIDLEIAEEAVARYCARSFGLPRSSPACARHTARWWPRSGTSKRSPRGSRSRPARPDAVQPDPTTTIAVQLEPLLDRASVPAFITNWGGDEPVSVQQWSQYFGELLRSRPRSMCDRSRAHRWVRWRPTRRQVHHRAVPFDWRDGYRRMAQQYTRTG